MTPQKALTKFNKAYDRIVSFYGYKGPMLPIYDRTHLYWKFVDNNQAIHVAKLVSELVDPDNTDVEEFIIPLNFQFLPSIYVQPTNTMIITTSFEGDTEITRLMILDNTRKL
jgi:hypothetical protein